MTDNSWTDEAQRFLDGDGDPPTDPTERGQAARFAAALGLYATQLDAPSAELDEWVLGAVRSRAGRRAWWRWLVLPRRVVVRPVMAAAAAVVLVVLSAVVGRVVAPAASPMATPRQRTA
jgi:hypothetical protein